MGKLRKEEESQNKESGSDIIFEMNTKDIKDLCNKYHKDLIEFCRQLIQTPSVNGQNSENKISNLVAEKAKNLGLPVRQIALDKKRPNVFVGEEFSKKSGLLFVAHLDTVPTGDETKWSHQPFSGDIEKNKLFGRGAIDCKAGIGLSVYTLKILSELGIKNKAKFAGVVDEESGADSKLGARYLLEKGLDAKAAIYTYPGVETVTIGHRGLVRLWVEVHGESNHTGSKSWQDGTKGASAVSALVDFLKELPKINMQGYHEAFAGYGFKHTPTIIEGGSGESIVPDTAKALIDARLLPNNKNEDYIYMIKKLTRVFETDKIKFEVKVKTNIPGVAISKSEKIVKVLSKLDKEVMGITPEVRGSGPASEGYMFVKAGIPTICGFGAEGNGVHSADEYLKTDTLPKIMEMYVRAALEF